jgi:small subunit ribosomal protein S18
VFGTSALSANSAVNPASAWRTAPAAHQRRASQVPPLRFIFPKIVLAPPRLSPTFHRFMSTENKTPNRSRNPMDYTFNDVEQLSRFVTETGKILPRKVTGLSSKHQRRITNRIKQARNMLTMQ